MTRYYVVVSETKDTSYPISAHFTLEAAVEAFRRTPDMRYQTIVEYNPTIPPVNMPWCIVKFGEKLMSITWLHSCRAMEVVVYGEENFSAMINTKDVEYAYEEGVRLYQQAREKSNA